MNLFKHPCRSCIVYACCDKDCDIYNKFRDYWAQFGSQSALIASTVVTLGLSFLLSFCIGKDWETLIHHTPYVWIACALFSFVWTRSLFMAVLGPFGFLTVFILHIMKFYVKR